MAHLDVSFSTYLALLINMFRAFHDKKIGKLFREGQRTLK